MLKIPYETLGADAPADGSAWRASFSRTHYAGDGRVEKSIWSVNPVTIGLDSLKAFGTIGFGCR